MAHIRKRHLEYLLKQLAKASPLVGLLGHRQVGKTTLLESLSSRYLSFDNEELLLEASRNPKKFLEQYHLVGTVLDECQLAEKLFPALKERVRQDKRPGQFYLSGSVRFTSKKLIRESLTGRIMTAELFPLTLSELDKTTLPDWIRRLLKAKRMQEIPLQSLASREQTRRMKLIDMYLRQGGLPGICFIRQEKIRVQKIMDQLETIFDRDLRQVHQTTLVLREVLNFVRQLSLLDGEPVQYQALRRITGISPLTQKKLLFALEAVFIIRHLPIEGDMHGSAIIFEDQAEVLALAQGGLSEERQWEGLVYRNIREQIFYQMGENADFFQYRTRSGVLVPLAVRSSGSILGFLPFKGELTPRLNAAAQSFLKHYGQGKIVFVSDGNEAKVINDRTLLLPATHLLFP